MIFGNRNCLTTFVIRIPPWRQSATANQDTNSRTHRIGIRQLRPAHAYSGIESQATGKTQEDRKGQTSAALATALTLKPLSLHFLFLKFFPGESFPGEAATRNLTAYEVKLSPSISLRPL